MVPWCPPFVQPGLCAVMVPAGEELTESRWRFALEDRINAMTARDPDGLEIANRALSAMGLMAIDQPYHAGGSLFGHNLELRTVLSLAMNSYRNPFPAKVPARMTPRMKGLLEEMEETDLLAWVEMALAEMSPR
jgi:hypothetical protein